MQKVSNLLFICILFAGTLFTLYAQSEDENLTAKHFAIVEADGYAYLAEDKTIRQMREEALANAKRDALEKGQTFIQSFTKIENFQLSYDLIQSQSEGFVKILESKDHGITSDNRYHYWIKAEIEYRLKMPDVKNAPELQSNPAAPLNVVLWTDKAVYQAGECINIFLKSNKDFYARVIYVNAQGDIVQLLPNQLRKDNFLKGGQVVTIPDAVDGFKIKVGPPFGREKIIVYASSAPQGEIASAPFGKSLIKLKSDLPTVGTAVRSVKSSEAIIDTPNGSEFFEATVGIETMKNPNEKRE